MNIIAFCILAPATLPNSVKAEDWPGILGPHRDGITTAPALHEQSWPEELKPTWKLDIGSGHAGPAIVNSTVLIPHRKGNTERLAAVKLDSGRLTWESEWPASYRGSINPDNGPRCVPVVAGERVVCYGAAGDLVCVRLDSGDQLWRRSLRSEYDADDGYFGAGSTPVVVDDLVIVCVGGRKAGIVAIELESGKTRWTATSYDASYASPISLRRGSEQLLLIVMRLNTVLLNARDGTLLSEVPFGSRGPTVNAATPIAINETDYLLTASYGVGTLIAGIDGIEIVERFRDKNLLSSQYNTPIKLAGRVFGINGREDVGIASLRAIDLGTREVLWDQPEFGTAHMIGINSDQLLALRLDGPLTLIDVTAPNYKPLEETLLPTGTYRALPALVKNQLIVRASHGPTESELMMFTLR